MFTSLFTVLGSLHDPELSIHAKVIFPGHPHDQVQHASLVQMVDQDSIHTKEDHRVGALQASWMSKKGQVEVLQKDNVVTWYVNEEQVGQVKSITITSKDKESERFVKIERVQGNDQENNGMFKFEFDDTSSAFYKRDAKSIIEKLECQSAFLENDQITVIQKGSGDLMQQYPWVIQKGEDDLMQKYPWAQFYVGGKNESKPQWAYKSMSDGAWHWSPGYKFNEDTRKLWILKPSGSHHYIQATLLDQRVQNEIEASEWSKEISPPLYLPMSLHKHYQYIATKKNRTKSEPEGWQEFEKFMERANRDQFLEQVFEEMENAFQPAVTKKEKLTNVRAGHLGGGETLGDAKEGQGVSLHDIEEYIKDANLHFSNHSDMYPNFEKCEQRYSFQHGFLGKVQVEVFKSPDNHLWHMARGTHEDFDKFWINRVVVPGAKLTDKGTYDVYADYGALLSKPVDYQDQTTAIPWSLFQVRFPDQNKTDRVDLASAFIHRFPVVENYIKKVQGKPIPFSKIIQNHRKFIEKASEENSFAQIMFQQYVLPDAYKNIDTQGDIHTQVTAQIRLLTAQLEKMIFNFTYRKLNKLLKKLEEVGIGNELTPYSVQLLQTADDEFSQNYQKFQKFLHFKTTEENSNHYHSSLLDLLYGPKSLSIVKEFGLEEITRLPIEM